jgi:rare lipoprotein A (peptidoglycan hydrolase)
LDVRQPKEDLALRPNLDWRAVLSGGALFIAYLCAAAMPSVSAGASPPASPRASADSQGTTPTATASKVGVSDRRLNVKAGSRAVVRGVIRPAGSTVALQIRRHRRWVTLDRDRTDAQGRYVLRNRMASPMSARARVRVVHGPAGKHGLGRLNVYRHALASWYGPGLYGMRTGCGGTLGTSQLGVAHKTLPCGTKVTLRHHGRVVRVPVIDRGPYSGAREFDLTAATARRLKFKGYGTILSTR